MEGSWDSGKVWRLRVRCLLRGTHKMFFCSSSESLRRILFVLLLHLIHNKQWHEKSRELLRAGELEHTARKVALKGRGGTHPGSLIQRKKSGSNPGGALVGSVGCPLAADVALFSQFVGGKEIEPQLSNTEVWNGEEGRKMGDNFGHRGKSQGWLLFPVPPATSGFRSAGPAQGQGTVERQSWAPPASSLGDDATRTQPPGA